MKKIFVLGMLVGIVSICGARAELVETVATTEDEVVSVENPPVVEPEMVEEPDYFDEEFEKSMIPEPEPEPEEEYVPTNNSPK